jgi:hypothetical protein
LLPTADDRLNRRNQISSPSPITRNLMGPGIPLGLAGQAIPLCGRIVAVADVCGVRRWIRFSV